MTVDCWPFLSLAPLSLVCVCLVCKQRRMGGTFACSPALPPTLFLFPAWQVTGLKGLTLLDKSKDPKNPSKRTEERAAVTFGEALVDSVYLNAPEHVELEVGTGAQAGAALCSVERRADWPGSCLVLGFACSNTGGVPHAHPATTHSHPHTRHAYCTAVAQVLRSQLIPLAGRMWWSGTRT